jgi:hypothetical protein
MDRIKTRAVFAGWREPEAPAGADAAPGLDEVLPPVDAAAALGIVKASAGTIEVDALMAGTGTLIVTESDNTAAASPVRAASSSWWSPAENGGGNIVKSPDASALACATTRPSARNSCPILQMEAPVRPRLRPLASFCKTDPPL